MGSLPPLVLAGAIAASVGELLHIVGLATPNWSEFKLRGVDVTSGLFQSCAEHICLNHNDVPAKLEAIQAMCILGMIAGLAAVGAAMVFILFTILSKSMPSIMGLVTLAAGSAAFVFVMIGVIVYASEVIDEKKVDINYGYSFGLTITGGILLLIGSIIFFVGAKSLE